LQLITINDTHKHTHWVGRLWTSDRPVIETSVLQHNIHNKQISTPTSGLEPAISATERRQTHALDRVPTVIGSIPQFTRHI